jgi:outer membrane protein assembly factor BamB
VAVGDLEGYVHFLDRETGAFVARFKTDGSPVRAAPKLIPGGLLVETQGGALYALSP